MKIAVNKCFGGFTLSDRAHERLIELGVPCFKSWEEMGENYNGIYIVKAEPIFGLNYASNLDENENRTNPLLIQVIEELREEASGRFGEVEITEIPDDVDWYISDYDGIETIHEKHRSW